MSSNVVKNKQITFVFGKLCSGKGTFCRKYSNVKPFIVSTSQIVSEISGETKRSKLGKTAHLDKLISNRIISIISDQDNVVIEGIRQLSIVEEIVSHYQSVSTIKFIWLEVPDNILRERFISRVDKKDDQIFEEAYIQDEALGLKDLELWIKNQKNTTIVENY